jgi:hypothetical protein
VDVIVDAWDERWEEEKGGGGKGGMKVVTAASHDLLLGTLRFR